MTTNQLRGVIADVLNADVEDQLSNTTMRFNGAVYAEAEDRGYSEAEIYVAWQEMLRESRAAEGDRDV